MALAVDGAADIERRNLVAAFNADKPTLGEYMPHEASHVDLLVLHSAGEGLPYVTSILVNAPVCLVAQDLNHSTRICSRKDALRWVNNDQFSTM